MTLPAGRRPLVAEARARPRPVELLRFAVGNVVLGEFVLTVLWPFPCQCHSTNALDACPSDTGIGSVSN